MILVGLGVAAAAYAGRYGVRAWRAYKAKPGKQLPKFHEGGFRSTMTRKEAALILGVRETSLEHMVKEAHRRLMVANHPDGGGSHYLAQKINEAKNIMVGKTNSSDPAF